MYALAFHPGCIPVHAQMSLQNRHQINNNLEHDEVITEDERMSESLTFCKFTVVYDNGKGSVVSKICKLCCLTPTFIPLSMLKLLHSDAWSEQDQHLTECITKSLIITVLGFYLQACTCITFQWFWKLSFHFFIACFFLDDLSSKGFYGCLFFWPAALHQVDSHTNLC